MQTVSDQWQGVKSAGVTAEWIAAATEVADASPNLYDVPIPVFAGDPFVPFSFQIDQDAPNFLQELRTARCSAAAQRRATLVSDPHGTVERMAVIERAPAACPKGTRSALTLADLLMGLGGARRPDRREAAT